MDDARRVIVRIRLEKCAALLTRIPTEVTSL